MDHKNMNYYRLVKNIMNQYDRGNILYLHYKYERGKIQGVLFVLFSLLLIDHCHFTVFRPVQLDEPETEVQYRLLPVIKPAEHLFHLSRHN